MSIWLFLIISNLHHYTDFITEYVELVGFESSRPWKGTSADSADVKHGEKLTDDDIKYKNQNDKLRAEIARLKKLLEEQNK